MVNSNLSSCLVLNYEKYTSRTKEVTKMLGINRERVKYSKKQGVFALEKTIKYGKNSEYTEMDVATLRKLPH